MEVSGRKADKMGVSLTGASQEDFELSCDPCSIDGHELPAAGFCVDCQHYLCEACYKCHCRPMPMRNHSLLDKSEMPLEKATTAKPKELCTEMCIQHKGKSVEYFCPPHDQLGCNACMIVNHRGCEGVGYIEDIAEGIEDRAEYKNLIMKLEAMEKQFNDNKCKTGQNIFQTKNCYSRAIEDIGKLRKEVNIVFDKLENEVKKEAKSIEDADIEKMNTLSARYSTAIHDIQKLNSDLEILRKTQQNNQLFIKIKKAKKNIKAFGEELAKVDNENQTRLYKFKPDPQIQNLLRGVKVFGQLKNHLDLKATRIQDIYVKSFSDKEQRSIHGLTVLADGRLIIIDSNNNSVKLLDRNQNKVKSQLKMTTKPWDITEIKTYEVAVTVPLKKIIQFVLVSDSSLSIGREITVDGVCQGIVCYDERLAVTFINPPKVEIMEMNGTVLNVISTDMNGDQLFSYPQYIAISPDRTTLYVSDKNKHSLTSLTMEGVVRAVYEVKDLKLPTGVCVDSDGTVYLCGRNSHNVHQITENFERRRLLLTKADGVLWPSSISYSNQEDKLYLAGTGDKLYRAWNDDNGGNIVQVFKLK